MSVPVPVPVVGDVSKCRASTGRAGATSTSTAPPPPNALPAVASRVHELLPGTPVCIAAPGTSPAPPPSSGPGLDTPTLPSATFTVEGLHRAFVAARLSAEYGIGVRHGCFGAHPYIRRLLHLSHGQSRAYRDAIRRGTGAAYPAPCAQRHHRHHRRRHRPPHPRRHHHRWRYPGPRSPISKSQTRATSGPTTPPQAGRPKTRPSARPAHAVDATGPEIHRAERRHSSTLAMLSGKVRHGYARRALGDTDTDLVTAKRRDVGM